MALSLKLLSPVLLLVVVILLVEVIPLVERPGSSKLYSLFFVLFESPILDDLLP